jgi:hypothetical protein
MQPSNNLQNSDEYLSISLQANLQQQQRKSGNERAGSNRGKKSKQGNSRNGKGGSYDPMERQTVSGIVGLKKNTDQIYLNQQHMNE